MLEIIRKLRELSTISILENWEQKISDDWQKVAVNQTGILLFQQGSDRQIQLRQIWQAPKYWHNLSLEATTLRLKLTYWASFAEVLVNGKKVHEGDLFDQKCRVLLDSTQSDFLLEINLRSPNHDRGALQLAEIIIESHQPVDPGKFAEELAMVLAYLPILAREFSLEKVIADLEQITDRQVDQSWLSELANIRRSLINLVGNFFKNRKIYILGNAHIDVAWLWAIAETKDVLKRTFNSVLNLQTTYPELIFNQTTALFYEWLEQEDPNLFKQIQQAVDHKSWEIIGGMWVEPDCNLPSGESLIRQIIYGKNYFLEKFNKDVKIAFMPDTFGFNAQLPQILLKSGFTAFITAKLNWNDTNKFPYQIFWWQGVDGSKIFTYFCNDLGLGLELSAIAKFSANQELQHGIKDALWLYGVGDHGGGPTADMLNMGREWSELSLELKPSTAEDFIQSLQQNLVDIPTWDDELYLEFHRGTYTSKADQKRQCRQAEILLGNVEKYLAIACIQDRNKIYPQQLLDQAWKGLLLNQFHDILPGSSIPEVFIDANQTWQEVRNICQKFISPSPNFDITQPLYLWNLCNWSRAEIVEITNINLDNLSIKQGDDLLPTQKTANGLIFKPRKVSGLSSVELNLVPNSDSCPDGSTAETHFLGRTEPQDAVKITYSTLENQYLKIDLDPNSGEIAQIFDKRSQNLLLSSSCELQFFADKGQYWDAWNIDPNYESQKLAGLTLESISIYEEGAIRSSWQVVRKFQKSTFTQIIQLDAYNPHLTVINHVDWQEQHVLVKADFPLNFESPFATYEIPMGAIARSTTDRAKWEVSAQFWADLSAAGIGLSVLNNCKYGYDAKPNHLRLTLLRSPYFPAPDSDRGIHEFTYRLVPHQGDWKSANIVQMGYELNNPLLIQSHSFGTAVSFCSNRLDHIVLSAFKRSQDGNSWILRFYESCGLAVNETMTCAQSIQSIHECDLMENIVAAVEFTNHQFFCQFQPYEIKTFILNF